MRIVRVIIIALLVIVVLAFAGMCVLVSDDGGPVIHQFIRFVASE